MRKILIPTDFSENAMNAVRYAMELFKYERSDFLVVHAYADDVYENTMEMPRALFEEFKEKVKEGTERELRKVIKEMLETSPNPRHNYDYISVFGSLVDVVNDLADKHDADIIIMGTKGKTDDRDITFGSQTLQVIRYVKCPVLAVPQKYHKNTPQHILFPTDYQVPYKKRELKLLSMLAKNFAASISFLHMSKTGVLSHRQADNQEFIYSCTEENQTAGHEIHGNNLTAEINKFIKDHGTNFLVMVNSRHSYLENLLRTSTIEKMALHSNIPFLVLQNLAR